MSNTHSGALEKWIAETMLADDIVSAYVGARIGSEDIEPETIFPYLIFVTKSNRNVGRLGKNRSNRAIFEVEFRFVQKFAPGLANYGELTGPSDRVAELFNERPSPATDGFKITGSVFLREVRRPEPLGEERLYHLGGVVRVYVERNP